MERKLSDMRKQTGGQAPASLATTPSSSSTAAADGESPSASRTFEGMYHVAAPRSVSEVDIGNVHDLSAGGSQAITAHQLHGKLPHRFQNRRQPHRAGSTGGDDRDSVHSGDSGVTSGGAAGLVSSTSSGYSSLSPSPSPSLGARASGASSTTCLYEAANTASLPASSSYSGTSVGRRLASVPCFHDDQHLFPDDSSSLDSTVEGCLNTRSPKPFQDDRSSGFCSLDTRDSPEKLSVSMSMEEDNYSMSESAHNRSKHFVVSRGPRRSRLTEVKSRAREDSYTELPSQSRIKVDTAQEISHGTTVVARLAKAEPDHDLDTSCCASVWDEEEDVDDESSRGCSSFGGDTSFGGDSEDLEEYKLWREEQKFSTRVQRRKQTVILSRSLRRQKVNVIEKGYKAFENIYMGDVGHDTTVSSISSSSRGRALSKNSHAKSSSTSQVRPDIRVVGPTDSQAELGQKIQHLINSSGEEPRKRGVRSRSFDSSRNNRVVVNSPRKDVGNHRANQTIDDIRLPSVQSGRKESTASLAKKSAALFSRMRDRPKQMKSPDYDVEAEQVECGPPSSQFLRSGCLGGNSGSPDSKYETNFGVIAGNIKAASSSTESRLPSSASCTAELGGCVMRRTNHLSPSDCAGQDGERCSAGNVTSSTIRDSSSSSISTGSEGCITPVSGASGQSSAEEAEYYPSDTKSWQTKSNRSLETAV